VACELSKQVGESRPDKTTQKGHSHPSTRNASDMARRPARRRSAAGSRARV